MLTYDKIRELKSEQNRLIAEGKTHKSAIVVSFTAVEREMFDKGIPMEAVFA